MRTNSAPTIKLKDYSPAPFTIRDVHLDISLEPENTQVNASITFVRADDTPYDTPLVLDGDELNLTAIALNGTPLNSLSLTNLSNLEHIII